MENPWRAWSERRRWRREMSGVPLHQLRGMVQGAHFSQNPAKQRWMSWWLWRREHLWGNPVGLAGLVVGIVALVVAVVGLIGRLCGKF